MLADPLQLLTMTLFHPVWHLSRQLPFVVAVSADGREQQRDRCCRLQALMTASL